MAERHRPPPHVPARRAGRACRADPRRSRRAGSTTARDRSCSTPSPGCRPIIRRGPRPPCCESIMPEVAGLIPAGAAVVEFGAGSATKTPILLRGDRPGRLRPGRYFGRLSARQRRANRQCVSRAGRASGRRRFPRPFDLPDAVSDLPRLGFFPGSTIGNFVPRSATDLLRQFRELLGHRGAAADRHGPGQAGRAADRRL